MSALSERSRRVTAGKRMTVLTGEAMEQDQSFWGHETWAEDDSGNESFHSSDEDSELKRDVFDSDFDDSESDNEEEELEAGKDEERELLIHERDGKAATTRAYVDSIKPSKDLVKTVKGSKRGNKRILGNGLNAGIVLNVPQSIQESQSDTASLPQPMILVQSAAAIQPSTKKKTKVDKIPTVTAATYRPTRKATRTGRQIANAEMPSSSVAASKSTVSVKKKKRRYSQEELLLEAVKITEPENERWLLGRKRQQFASEKEKESTTREARGATIEKFVSRRGYLNTIIFPDMEYLPPILKRTVEISQPSSPLLCAITGKLARYRDPKTQLGFFDAAAFKELRRRYEDKEALESIALSATSNNLDTKPLHNTNLAQSDSINKHLTNGSQQDIQLFLGHNNSGVALKSKDSFKCRTESSGKKLISKRKASSFEDSTFIPNPAQVHTKGLAEAFTLPTGSVSSSTNFHTSLKHKTGETLPHATSLLTKNGIPERTFYKDAAVTSGAADSSINANILENGNHVNFSCNEASSQSEPVSTNSMNSLKILDPLSIFEHEVHVSVVDALKPISVDTTIDCGENQANEIQETDIRDVRHKNGKFLRYDKNTEDPNNAIHTSEVSIPISPQQKKVRPLARDVSPAKASNSPNQGAVTNLPGSRRSPRRREPSVRLLESFESDGDSLLLIPSSTSLIMSDSETKGSVSKTILTRKGAGLTEDFASQHKDNNPA